MEVGGNVRLLAVASILCVGRGRDRGPSCSPTSWSELAVNFAHLHLVMNHVPTIGSVAALGVLLLGYVRRNDHLKHVGLEVLFIVALLTLPVYVTGVAGYYEIARPTGRVGRRHQTPSGRRALRIRLDDDCRLRRVDRLVDNGDDTGALRRGLVPAATVLLVMSLVVMGRAANLGGEIRHPEILAPAGAAAPAGDPDRFVASAITQVAVYSRWVWPAAETVHFLGLCLSFGVLLAINLRLLGFLSRIPFADVHRLLPWGMLGFGANLITGMFFFVGQPGQYVGERAVLLEDRSSC